MIVVNPPHPLETELRMLLPALKAVLAENPQARWALEWLAGETVAPNE
jgi:23S rRNA (adenine2030-N6)-methyltransferase